MASKLILDRSDPGVNDLVASWKDGETYRVELEIVQESTSVNTGDYTVTEVVPIEAEVEEPVPAPAPKSGVMPVTE